MRRIIEDGEMNTIAESNMNEIFGYFDNFLKQIDYEGYFGIAKFSNVYSELMPIQKEKLNQLLNSQINEFNQTGSIISIGICYKPEIIEFINLKNSDGIMDKNKWNIYAQEYENINNLLIKVGKKIAENYNGIFIQPITGIPDEQIKNVRDYYPHTISHRIVAEHAGIGWRGKNELIITEKHGPALRFASILINIPLIQNQKQISKCGNCTACLDVCSILKNKEKLSDYRNSCRKYILSLGLETDVCGKCIKVCLRKRQKIQSN
ncbi:MAG: hypothetical protein ACFFC3_15655 [Candidatus Odinarchaeota archaeon]